MVCGLVPSFAVILGPSQAVISTAYPGLHWPLPAGWAHPLKFLPDRLRLLAFQKHELFKDLHYASKITELNSDFKIYFLKCQCVKIVSLEYLFFKMLICYFNKSC